MIPWRPSLRFYLGTHHPDWLARAGVPLFVSHRALARYKTLPRASAPWALDSGGFSELNLNGAWVTSSAHYAAAVRRYRDDVGTLDWAAPMDWMCEPQMLARTGLSVAEHLRRTVNNFVELRTIAPDLPFIPVLQGWTHGDYYRCIDLYTAAGIDLWSLPTVGVGTVCRRQNTLSTSLLLAELAREGLRLHGFGLKLAGLRSSAEHLASADSMAWSYNARRSAPIAGHPHKNCANCIEWAIDWRNKVIDTINQREALRGKP